ncbi:OmpA domain protein [Smithella sp. ME-1]|uniref:Outer membrane protein a n=1 Tax=hydrocarbon metagenome TaxID=938273 RepID=A0A0W8FRF5_9ZZZZ|nr:OmpA domain protein [Smithella sp. ME-1]
MKKIGILAIIIMLTAVVTAAQAEPRAGGLPELTIDNRIPDCGCPPCCGPTSPTTVTIALNVEFDTNSAVVKEKYHNEIERVANFMKTYPKTTAVIEGHTDNVASAEYNQNLSQARASSVRQYLIDKFGIKASRLSAIGYGLTKPIAGNDTEEGKQRNRRVQAVIKTVKNN